MRELSQNAKRFMTLLSVCLVALVGYAPQALACSEPDPTPPTFECTVTGGSTLQLRLTGQQTFFTAVPTFCACALDTAVSGSTIASVDSVKFVVAGTNTEILSGDFAFSGNAFTSAGFEAVQSGNWVGFATPSIPAIAGGIGFEILFDITTTGTASCSGTTLEVTQAGGLGTDEATVTGALTGNHQNIVTIALIPTITEWGLMVMLLLFVAVGTLVWSQRPVGAAAVAGGGQIEVGSRPLFAPGLFLKVLAATVGMAVLAFAWSVWVYGELTGANAGGGLACALVGAYVLHLWIGLSRERE